MTGRINNPESCICCARRSDGLAVGRPNQLGWYCNECGPDLAKIALKMAAKRELDIYERRACAQVAELCGTSEITLNKDELADFIAWAVTEFGTEIRKQIDGNEAPF